MTWSYTAHHKFISESLGFMSALHPHHIIIRCSVTHHNLFLIIHFFRSWKSVKPLWYLFIYFPCKISALILLQLRINLVILWFDSIGGNVFRISWFKKKKFQERQCYPSLHALYYILFSANISSQQHMPHGWLNKRKKEKLRGWVLTCKHAWKNINTKLQNKV